MSTGQASLLERHSEATRKLMLEAALELLERYGVNDLTVRAVARHAGMSERTVFRYFPSRDAFLGAVAAQVSEVIDAPPLPETAEELVGYAAALYARFEDKSDLVRAALHSEIFERIRQTVASDRWVGVQRLIDIAAPRQSARKRKITAANIRYFLAASTWNYYRSYYGFSPEDALACAKSAIGLALADGLETQRAA